MENKLFCASWVKRNGRLSFKRETDALMFQAHVENLREGQVIQLVADFEGDDGRLAQLAKLKSGIKLLARESGVKFMEMQDSIKRDAGLTKITDDGFKSFGDCSKQELSDAIVVLIETADFLNVKLP